MTRAKIEQRLSGYWKMEAANVVFIPAVVAFLASSLDWRLGIASIGPFVPVCLLLGIGAQYWRVKLEQVQSGSALPRTIGMIARLRLPSFVLSILSVGLTLAAWIAPGVALSQADRWVSTVLTLLAVAEYVNYYHRQVQHFDHWPDLKRLLSGRGFRRSQMALDIARWRAINPPR